MHDPVFHICRWHALFLSVGALICSGGFFVLHDFQSNALNTSLVRIEDGES